MKNINRIQVVIFLMAVIAFALFNNHLIPSRKELVELELTEVIGMDKIEEGKYKYEQTVLRSQTQEAKSEDSESSGGKPNVFSVKGATFSDIIRTFQTYTNKTLAGSHIKFMILGEDFCKKDLNMSVDFNVRDYETRFNANVYLAKELSAREFITKVSSNTYNLDEKILSMEKNNDAKNVSYDTNLLDLLEVLSKENSCGLIPTLEIISPEGDTNTSPDKNNSDDIQGFQSTTIKKEKDSEAFFDFGGYGIIHKHQLVGYLDKSDSITTNILKNRKNGTNINIELEEGYVSFGMLDAQTSYKFKFNNGNLTDIMVNIKSKFNIEEINTQEDIFGYEKMQEMESKVKEQLSKNVSKVIEKMREYDCDFLNIEDMVKIKHPYKYRKLKENFKEELLKANFVLAVNVKVLRTYDILKLS